MVGLEPGRLSPVASINRAVLDGRAARDVLGAPALVRLAREAGLRPAGPVRSYLDGLLDADDPAAATVADEFGDRLRRLLVALRSGDRRVRAEWTDPSWWQRWAAATTIWLGGGLAGGPFGRRVAARAGCCVPDGPEDLPLTGAATLSAGGPVLDFGHSWVKRGHRRDGTLRRLGSVPAPPADATGAQVAEQVARILRESGTGEPIVAAMAAYVIDGRPVRTPLGTYARLADVSEDVPGWLAARAGVPVTLVHDGTAAAHAVPPDPRSIVVLLGTSLGVGFPG